MIKIGLPFNLKYMTLTKKSDDNQVVTKGILKKELKGLEKKMDKKMDNLWDRFFEYAASKDDLKKLEERIMGRLDYIVYELENLRTDRDSQILINDRVDENLINHEKRIKVLEKV